MKRSILLTLALAVAAPLFAIDVDPKLDQAVRAALPVCADMKLSYDEPAFSLPEHFKGAVVFVESVHCGGQYMAAVSPTGGFFLGSPWPVGNEEGKTVEEKVKAFGFRNMHQVMDVSVERTPTEDGLWPITITQTTEAGKLPLSGFIDPKGKVFFFGNFRRMNADIPAQRVKSLDPYIADMPAKGASKGEVTIVEFSDFQCPSCKRASGYVDAILAKHADKVRYVRYDLPLSGHPWAFGAALAGRAIYRQKPELFWDYKKNVYANQENLNAFMVWDWARAWAEDHDLDLKRYDADLADATIKSTILKGAGAAFSNDVRATPTYYVNGVSVDAGEDGKALADYVEKVLAK